jgi:hypothetical protein
MIKAIYLASEIVRNRTEYLDMHANSLERRKQKSIISEAGEEIEEENIIPEE